MEVVLSVVFALTVIECVALCHGINGTLMTLVIAILAAIGGVAIPTDKFIKSK